MFTNADSVKPGFTGEHDIEMDFEVRVRHLAADHPLQLTAAPEDHCCILTCRCGWKASVAAGEELRARAEATALHEAHVRAEAGD